MNTVKVKDLPGHVRDTRSNAILCVDDSALTAYRAKRDRERNLSSMQDDINKVKTDIREIKDFVEEIKTLLKDCTRGK